MKKKPLGEIYKKSFFSRRYKLDWRAKYVCDAVVGTFNMVAGWTLIDVGCAIGEYVRKFKEEYGILSEGIEGSPEAKDFFVTDGIMVLDLREKLRLFSKYDVCMSLEVAEHIEPKYADQYVDNLVNLSDNILITAAPQGQGGHHHVNCRSKHYWERKFFVNKYYRDFDSEVIFKCHLKCVSHRKEIASYIKNCMIFRKVA